MKGWMIGFIFTLSSSFAVAADRDCAKEIFSLNLGWRLAHELSAEIDDRDSNIPKNLADLCKDTNNFAASDSMARIDLIEYKKSQIELKRNSTISIETLPLGHTNPDHLPAAISNEDLCEIVDKNLKVSVECEVPHAYLSAVMKSDILTDIKSVCVQHIQEFSKLSKKCRKPLRD